MDHSPYSNHLSPLGSSNHMQLGYNSPNLDCNSEYSQAEYNQTILTQHNGDYTPVSMGRIDFTMKVKYERYFLCHGIIFVTFIHCLQNTFWPATSDANFMQYQHVDPYSPPYSAQGADDQLGYDNSMLGYANTEMTNGGEGIGRLLRPLPTLDEVNEVS